MSLSDTTNRNNYTGNGSTATYAYNFKIFLESDLEVKITDTSDDSVVTLVLNTDYTVSGEGDQSGGNIVLIDAGQAWIDGSSFLDSGYDLSIRRVRPLTQITDIRNQGPSYPSAVEDGIDHAVMLCQQQQDEINRAIRFPSTEDGSIPNSELPSATSRANKFLAFDADGEPIASSGGISSSLAVSSFIETLLDDTTAVEARATLGVTGDISSGTKMLFYQASAPTGWTAVAVNDKFLRVVTAGGTGGTSGGSGLTPSSTISLSHVHTVDSHTHSIAQHTHDFDYDLFGSSTVDTNAKSGTANSDGQSVYQIVNGGDTIRHIKSVTKIGGATASGSATPDTDSKLSDTAFQYADVIIAQKD